MGMFDYIFFSKNIFPFQGEEVIELQTKSLNNSLDTYYVNENGQLLISIFNELDFEVKKPYNYTGEISVYHNEKLYKALFDDGKLLLLKEINENNSIR